MRRNFGGIAGDYGARRNIPSHHTACPDDRFGTDSDSTKKVTPEPMEAPPACYAWKRRRQSDSV